MMEYWNIGIMDIKCGKIPQFNFAIFLTHHSTIPLFQYSCPI
jgi:hypothetical protein